MIYLFRHGQVEGPAALYGKTDIALSEAGRLALGNAVAVVEKPDLIMTSPLRRCSEFAQDTAQTLQCSLKVVDNLREMDFGQWDGVPYQADSEAWPAMEQFWKDPAHNCPPDGESLQHMQQRVTSAWQAVIAEHDKSTWVFAHGGVIRLILAQILDLDWRNPMLYSTLQIGYASRTDIHHEICDSYAATRVMCIGVPAPV